MPKRKTKATRANSDKIKMQRPPGTDVDAIISALKRRATQKTRDGMARYAISSDKAFGVPVGKIRDLGKRLGRNHELAAVLWDTGWYEARMLAAFVDEPSRVTPAQMDRWCRDFDNWAICDHVCFHLFDRTPHAWAKVQQWSRPVPEVRATKNKSDEFVKRAAFALLASLALHKPREMGISREQGIPRAQGISHEQADEPFARCLPLIERAANDERNFVKKGVSWALRGVGRRSPALHAAAVALARRLAGSPEAAARWVGKDALRDLTRPAVTPRLAARSR